MLGEIYQHTPAVLTLHGKDLPIRPTRGMKEGCPLSPTLFLLYYDILLRETMERCPGARLYVFVDATQWDYASTRTKLKCATGPRTTT